MLSAISDINPQASTNFKYDARNRQVSRVVNGAATFYIYDNWNLLEEYTANVTPEVAYLHGVGIDKLISKKDSQNITVYYHHDALGNVVALSNTSGALVERYRYDLFGYPLIQNASASYLGSSAYNNRFLFTGREWLAALNIYDYRNRQYSPHIGRFLQTDPIRFDAGDVNLYRYVGNSSVNWADPFGLESTKCCVKAKRDEGAKSIKDQVKKLSKEIKADRTIEKSCANWNIPLGSGISQPNCWSCSIENRSKQAWLGGIIDHWVVICESKDENGAKAETLTFDLTGGYTDSKKFRKDFPDYIDKVPGIPQSCR